jgi:hypothetical protein
LANDDDRALHNDIVGEIQDMCGPNMKTLLEKVAYVIIGVAKR